MTLNELISGYTADGGKLSGDDLRAASRTASMTGRLGGCTAATTTGS